MKRFFLITGLLVGLLIVGGISRPAQAQEHLESPDIVAEVNGMACPFCAYGVRRKLLRLEGVEQVAVSVADGTAQLKLEEGATLSEEKIVQAIDEAGFDAGSIEYKNEAARPGDESASTSEDGSAGKQ